MLAMKGRSCPGLRLRLTDRWGDAGADFDLLPLGRISTCYRWGGFRLVTAGADFDLLPLGRIATCYRWGGLRLVYCSTLYTCAAFIF
jgi:hypothetical protein